jgi:hypothetical protein
MVIFILGLGENSTKKKEKRNKKICKKFSTQQTSANGLTSGIIVLNQLE